MLGWEFPPFISGGLGTACHGLVCAMGHLDVDITMLLPMTIQDLDGTARAGAEGEYCTLAGLKHVVLKSVPSTVPNPYRKSKSRSIRVFGTGQAGGYDGNLVDRVYEYAQRCVELVETETFDVIHAHDWVTFPAGIALQNMLQKPLVVHVHATEFDRSGPNVYRPIYEIERHGMKAASAVIAVSNYTAGIVSRHYGVPLKKIHVVHNGINPKPIAARPSDRLSKAIVLFLGRITSQKGPEYFVKAAQQVLSKRNNVRFIMAGWGDLAPDIIKMVAYNGLGTRILFAGFLRGSQVDTAYRMSDLYVMPSVSEPFGLTALEAVQQDLPVIISRTTGVGEVLRKGAMKVDFWDVNKMAEQIVEILNNPGLGQRLRATAKDEIKQLTWDAAARKCVVVYNDIGVPMEQIYWNN
jgi:glycosyltransferase involved in cell wall biosynthesis